MFSLYEEIFSLLRIDKKIETIDQMFSFVMVKHCFILKEGLMIQCAGSIYVNHTVDMKNFFNKTSSAVPGNYILVQFQTFTPIILPTRTFKTFGEAYSSISLSQSGQQSNVG